MNRWLYLDDLRTPEIKSFSIARTVEEAIEIYHRFSNMNNKVFILSLDHDLGGVDGLYTKTGYDFCKWLVEACCIDKIVQYPDEIYLHTANPVGRDNMYQLLDHYMSDNTKIYKCPLPYYKDGD